MWDYLLLVYSLYILNGCYYFILSLWLHKGCEKFVPVIINYPLALYKGSNIIMYADLVQLHICKLKCWSLWYKGFQFNVWLYYVFCSTDTKKHFIRGAWTFQSFQGSHQEDNQLNCSWICREGIFVICEI